MSAETTSPPAQRPSPRPIIAFFDVDNTLMRGTSLFQLGREAWRRGMVRWRDIALFAWHQFRFVRRGENNDHLATAREKALGLVGGHTVEDIREVAESIWEHRIAKRLYPETVELTQEHIRKGHEVWLVSATPVEVGSVIAKHLGLTGALGTVVEVVDGVYTGHLVGHVLHNEEKVIAVRALADKAGAKLEDCWAYSDSRNDIPLLEAVGHPTVVNPDAILALHAARHSWPILRLKPKSIREQQRRVRREAREVERGAERPPREQKSAQPGD